MIIFYDSNGNVNGYLQAHPSVEQGALLGGSSCMQLGGDLADRLSNDKDPLQHYHLRVRNGTVEELPQKDKDKLKERWLKAKLDHKDTLKRSASL